MIILIIHNKRDYKLFECENQKQEEYVCELRSDICNFVKRRDGEECDYYKKVVRHNEICFPSKDKTITFCNEGELINDMCLLEIEGETAKYRSVITIMEREINKETLSDKCQTVELNNSIDYRCGRILIKYEK